VPECLFYFFFLLRILPFYSGGLPPLILSGSFGHSQPLNPLSFATRSTKIACTRICFDGVPQLPLVQENYSVFALSPNPSPPRLAFFSYNRGPHLSDPSLFSVSDLSVCLLFPLGRPPPEQRVSRATPPPSLPQEEVMIGRCDCFPESFSPPIPT